MSENTKKGLLIIVAILLVACCVYLLVGAILSKTQEVKNPILSLDIENYGTVKIELYPEYAPNTVKNIIKLVQNGYYNGKVIYGADEISVYVGRNTDGEIEDAKLSTLNPETSEEDDFSYEINGEFAANGFDQNTLRHEKGVVSMVRTNYSSQIPTLTEESFNSASSQFTILTDNERNLNGMYAAFGKVIEGMDTIEAIYTLDKKEVTEENTEDTSIEQFAQMPVITNATVETYGIDYGYPEVHEAFDYSAYLQQLLSQYQTNMQ